MLDRVLGYLNRLPLAEGQSNKSHLLRPEVGQLSSVRPRSGAGPRAFVCLAQGSQPAFLPEGRRVRLAQGGCGPCCTNAQRAQLSGRQPLCLLDTRWGGISDGTRGSDGRTPRGPAAAAAAEGIFGGKRKLKMNKEVKEPFSL